MKTQSQSNKHTVRNLGIFAFLVITAGWFGLWLNALTGSSSPQGSLGMLIWLIMPLAASLILRAFAGDGWKDLGIKPAIKGNALWYAVSILVYPIGVTIILAIGFALGGVSFPDSSANAAGVFISALGVAFLPTFFKNIFEEFGWRGYLAPKIFTLGLNDMVAHVIVGIIWAVWHVPYYLGLIDNSMLQGYTTQNLATFIPLVFVGLIAASIIYGEIRIKTGSVWPAVLMHTISNVLINTLVLGGYIRMASDLEVVVTPGMEGVLSIVFITLIGIGIYWLRKNE